MLNQLAVLDLYRRRSPIKKAILRKPYKHMLNNKINHNISQISLQKEAMHFLFIMKKNQLSATAVQGTHSKFAQVRKRIQALLNISNYGEILQIKMMIRI